MYVWIVLLLNLCVVLFNEPGRSSLWHRSLRRTLVLQQLRRPGEACLMESYKQKTIR